MRDLIDACAARPVAVVMAIVAVALAGSLSAANMGLDRMPPIAVPRIIVEAPYPGMGADELRSMVAQPLEDALASVKGAEGIRSVSRDGGASVVLDFRWGEDPSRAASRVREAVDSVYPSLPEGAEKPIVLPFDPETEPLLTVSVESRGGDLSSARRFAEYELRSRLRKVEGTGVVAIAGGTVREAAVEVDLERAAIHGMTVADVARILSAESADLPAGTAREGDLELTVIAAGRPGSIAELGRLRLSGPGGAFSLQNIARATEREAEKKSVFVAGGAERVSLEVFRRPEADPVAVSRRLRAELQKATESFSDDFKIEVLDDSSAAIARSISDLAVSAAFGAIVAALVLSAFLRDVRASVLIALTFPLSAAAAVATLAAAGRTLNGMSLGGIALGMGLVSDNAVVVLDILSAAFQAAERRPSPREIAGEVSSVAASTLSGVLTTAVVFAPVLFLPGPIGAIFGDLAVAVISANAAGWLLALFALPALYRVLRRPGLARFSRRIRQAYRRPLGAALRHPLATLSAAAVFAVMGAAVVLTREVAFLPVEAATELQVEVVFPPGADFRRVARDAVSLSEALSGLPSIERVFGRAGAERDDAARRADPDFLRERLLLRCPLVPGADPADSLAALRKALAEAAPPDVRTLAAPAKDPVAAVLGLSGATTLAVRGSTRAEAKDRAEAAIVALRREAGSALASIEIRSSRTRPEIRLLPDREAAASLGISLSSGAAASYAALEGVTVSHLEIEGRIMEVRVLGKPSKGDVLERVRNIPVSVLGSSPVAASTVVEASRKEGESSYFRLDRQDAVYLDALPAQGRNRALTAAVAATARRQDGVAQADESAFRRYSAALGSTLALVLLLLFLTLAAQFESFSLPLLLLTTLPLSLAGAGPALAAVRAGLDSGSVLGLVVLFGTAVNGAVVLYETSAERAARGASAAVASYAGALERVRPVLVTTIATVVALVPVVFSSGGAAQRSMSAAMVGGMLASTGLTLFVAPVLFVRFLRTRGEKEDR